MTQSLSIEDRWMFVSGHPAQIELADLLENSVETPCTIKVRRERWKLRLDCEKLTNSEAGRKAIDPEQWRFELFLAHSYNRNTDRGLTFISYLLRLRQIYNLPGPHEGRPSPTDMIIKDFAWEGFYPDFDRSFKQANVTRLIKTFKGSPGGVASLLEFCFEGRRPASPGVVSALGASGTKEYRNLGYESP